MGSGEDDDVIAGETTYGNHSAADVPMLATHTVTELERSATLLCVEEPEADLHAWLNLADVLTARAKQIRQAVERVAIEWIEVHGPLRMGEVLFTIVHQKAVKCVYPVACLERVIESCEGDLEAALSYVRSDPFKYGSVRGLLGDGLFEQLFRTEQKVKLVEGSQRRSCCGWTPASCRPAGGTGAWRNAGKRLKAAPNAPRRRATSGDRRVLSPYVVISSKPAATSAN